MPHVTRDSADRPADDKLLGRIRGLLAQAEDPACTPAEAEAFSAKAESLIARYAVDAALLEAKEHRGRPTTRVFDFPAPYAKPKGQLLAGVATAYGCRVLSRRDEGFTVVGYASDIDAVAMLWTSLLVQGSHACRAGDRSYRSSFWYGFSQRVADRMREQRAEAVAEADGASGGAGAGSGPGAALVLADRSAEVERHARDLFPRTRAGRAGRATSLAGLVAGDEAGARADLGGQRLGGRPQSAS